MGDGELKDNSMSDSNPGMEWRSGFREGILRKYSLWHFPPLIENAKKPIPTVEEMLQPLADNVDATPIHSVYRPNEVVSIMEPVANIAVLAGETPYDRGSNTYSYTWPNVYRIWDSDNTAEEYWSDPKNGKEAAALKKIYGGLAGAGRQITDPREVLQFVQHVTHAVGTTPVLTEFGRETGLLQAALQSGHTVRGRTDGLDPTDSKYFPLNLEILEGVQTDPIEFHKKLNDEIVKGRSRRGEKARTLREVRGLDSYRWD